MDDKEPLRTIGTVLVAMDFSAGSRLALERAARLPLRLGASLDLLHVLPEDADALGAEQMELSAKRLLEEARQGTSRILETKGIKDRATWVSVARGKTFVEIIRNARHDRAELIVVGRHGESTFRDALIGSTAERVIRKGDVSVLVVTKPAEAAYRRPLIAVDMSDSSRLALALALRICDPAVRKIDVIHVVSLPSPAYVTEQSLLSDIERRRLEEQQRAQAELSEFLSKIDAAVEWNLIVTSGDPRRVILDEAVRRNSDLIALGTKGRSGLPHLLIGSVAEGVLRAAACDVLVARVPSVDFSLP